MAVKRDITLEKMAKELKENGYQVIKSGFRVCMSCGKELSVNQNNFFMSNSDFHKSNSAIAKIVKKSKGNTLESRNFVPYCKDCLCSVLDFKHNTNTILIPLHLMDRPFLQDVWESTIATKPIGSASDSSIFGTYLKNINLNHKDLTFKDGESEGMETIEEPMFEGQQVKLSKKAIKILQDYWGFGYSNETYDYLENERLKLEMSFECKDQGMRLILNDICWFNYDIFEKRKRGEDVSKLITSRQALMNDGNLKPMQSSGANATEQLSYGLFMEKVENTRPTGEPDPLWADVDGLKKTVRVWFLGHLCSLMGIQNRLSKEYQDEYNAELARHTVEKDDDIIDEIDLDKIDDDEENDEIESSKEVI